MNDILSFENGMIAILSAVLIFLGKAYLVPFLQIEKRRRYAQWIAHLADEITDDLVARHPENRWIKFLDEAVDQLMEACGIEKDIAGRAINSAMLRKPERTSA